eukprot:1275976-Pyramimonas_sp.AAC.1
MRDRRPAALRHAEGKNVAVDTKTKIEMTNVPVPQLPRLHSTSWEKLASHRNSYVRQGEPRRHLHVLVARLRA